MKLLIKALFIGVLSIAALYAEPACSLQTVRGTYAFATSGNAVINQQIYFFAATGRLKADGAGKLTAKDTSSTNGEIQRRAYSGSYVVAADCTGSIKFVVGDQEANFDIVMSPDGKELLFIQTDHGIVSSGTARLHSLPDGPPQ